MNLAATYYEIIMLALRTARQTITISSGEIDEEQFDAALEAVCIQTGPEGVTE